MRVCQLSVTHRHIDERILQKISVSLARNGHEVVFLVPFDSDEYEHHGVKVRPLPLPRNRFDRVLRGVPRALLRVLPGRYDVVHVHDPELFPLVFALRLFGKRVIMDVHEDYGWIAAERVGAPILRDLARWTLWSVQAFCGYAASAVITVDSVIESRFPMSRTTVVGNFPPRGVSEYTRPANRRPEDPLQVVYVGNMSPDRGIDKIVEAVDLLEDVPVQLHLLGDMQQYDWLSQVKHPERFFAHGRLPWEETLALLRSFDVGVLFFQPNLVLQHVSGWGNTKLFEYLGSGLVALISDFPMLRKLAAETGGAVCVDPTSPESIAGALRALVRDRERLEGLSIAGQSGVRKRYNWEHEEAKLLRVYEALSNTGC